MGKQGSGPDRGQSPVEWGDFPSVHSPLWAIQPGLSPSKPGLRPSQPGLRPSQPGHEAQPASPGAQPASPEAQPASPEAQPARSEAQPASQASGFRPGWLGLRPGWMAQRGERTYVRTDGRTDVRTENLPILQDFVPFRGRCPASQRKIYANKEKQGKGIADHLMPLGDWLYSFLGDL